MFAFRKGEHSKTLEHERDTRNIIGQISAVNLVASMTECFNSSVQPCDRTSRVAAVRAISPRARSILNWSWLAVFSLAAAAAVLLVASPVSGNEVKGLGFYPPFESFNARGEDTCLPLCLCLRNAASELES